jgi:hypothetical protein
MFTKVTKDNISILISNKITPNAFLKAGGQDVFLSRQEQIDLILAYESRISKLSKLLLIGEYKLGGQNHLSFFNKMTGSSVLGFNATTKRKILTGEICKEVFTTGDDFLLGSKTHITPMYSLTSDKVLEVMQKKYQPNSPRALLSEDHALSVYRKIIFDCLFKKNKFISYDLIGGETFVTIKSKNEFFKKILSEGVEGEFKKEFLELYKISEKIHEHGLVDYLEDFSM